MARSAGALFYLVGHRIARNARGQRLHGARVAPAASTRRGRARLGGAATIDWLIHRWRRALAVEPHATGPSPPVRLKPGTTTDGSSSRLVGTELRRLVWDPLAGHVNGASRLFIVPDAALGLVPFAALPAGSTAYLIDSCASHRCTTCRQSATSCRRPRSRRRQAVDCWLWRTGVRRRQGAGSRTRHRTGTAAPGGSVSSSTRLAPGACDGVETLRFDPRNETSLEAQEVARLWQGSSDATDARPVRLPVGPSCERARVQERGAQLSRASHRDAWLLSGSPLRRSRRRQPGSRRTLVGTGPAGSGAPARESACSPASPSPARIDAPPPGDQEDGILTAEEVAALDLGGVEWAVLSACDTGVGEIKAGEGVFGLRRAFQIAGVRTVIMSLWAVDDQAARRWMRALYVRAPAEATCDRGRRA